MRGFDIMSIGKTTGTAANKKELDKLANEKR